MMMGTNKDQAIAKKTQELLESDDNLVNIETKFWLMIRDETNEDKYDLVGRMVERIERIVEANTDVAICRVYDVGSGEKPARLIAATPKLLDALKTFLDCGAGNKCFNSSRLYEAEQAYVIAIAALEGL